MNIETMVLGTALIAVGLYNTYFVPSEKDFMSEIFLLSTGAIIVDYANNDTNVVDAAQNIGKRMVGIKGMK